jgi:hypothetical protein
MGARAEPQVPKFEVDPYWPKPLPGDWVTGQLGSVCVDAQDHVFVLNRQNWEEKEAEIGTPAPLVIEFDPEGNVVNSFGDARVLPKLLHGCFVDYENNLWIAGSGDGVIQKYTHDGGRLLLQIGTRGVVDSSDGSLEGRALNSSRTGFFKPAAIAVDPSNGDIYVADGYGNSRIAVFDRDGQFLRQWGRQGTLADAESGAGGAFIETVHCVMIDHSGLVYVCDKQGARVQVFDKMGNFQRNFLVTPRPHFPNAHPTESGSWVSWMGFSSDAGQRFLYVLDEWRDQIQIFDSPDGATDRTLWAPRPSIGRVHALPYDGGGLQGQHLRGRVRLWTKDSKVWDRIVALVLAIPRQS